MQRYILAIDQGTTSSRAIIFSTDAQIIATAQKEFKQYYPADGWVEHDANTIWQDTLETCRQAIKDAEIKAFEIAAIGITNQRETTVIWNKETGEPIHRAIVWQDRRTADLCSELKSKDLETVIQDKTGLLVDPYFSATKIRWILDDVESARADAEAGKLLFGTIDTWILWHLTKGECHATDASNASRTQLFNIHTQQWDQELLDIFDIPAALLPEVKDSSDDFGVTDAALFGEALPVTAIAGDQQAALIGQGCLEPGMAKSTYGTGCFLMLNTGNQVVASKSRLLTTVAYRIDGQATYAVEGSIFVAGAAVQWLRDGLKMISHARETESLARATGDTGGVYLVPAFTGLGAPFWDPEARGAILGLTRDTGIGEIVTAGLQSVCYQTRDLMEAMASDSSVVPKTIRVDGGMVVNSWLVQCLADLLRVQVDRPAVTETTALGVAYLAGLKVGIYKDLDDISSLWQRESRFEPQMPEEASAELYQGWLNAVQRVRG